MQRKIITCLFVCASIGASFAQDKPKVDTIVKKERKKFHIIADSIYKERASQERLDGNYIPRDLLDAFKELDKIIVGPAKDRFMAFSDEEVDKRTHRKIGFLLKEKWGMYEGSRYTAFFKRMGINSIEYMIGITIQSYHRKLHGKDLKVKEQVEFFKKLAK